MAALEGLLSLIMRFNEESKYGVKKPSVTGNKKGNKKDQSEDIPY